MASILTEKIRQRLVIAGFDSDQFQVAVGWAEFPHRATTREDLMLAALEALEISKSGDAERLAEHGGHSTEPATGSA